ncbi:hypothetical protein Bb109J_c1273 [Bdellovibrio bacteriovorus]|uniref:hypothetical protein n=1 Tax=Bdellovibrio bacteriovorus TaxID=959 RepID=UPI00045BFD0F|nr:hypothetical protein [Bdellovibrio bacteriovorus]AHZ86606.1 hypothetical protein EP01_16940 [Bdellovibrio bacteriovorus]BEV67853.1 hypothetical protein Bb109J_c1273 [Bdellovibrio bacteriovorus]
MKKLMISAFVLFLSLNAGASVSKLVCVPGYEPMRADAVIEIVFNRTIDPLKPVIGSYNLGAVLKLHDKITGQTYTRSDVVLVPATSMDDVNLRGGAAGMVHIRVNPVLKNGAFMGRYTGDLFVNDLDSRNYYNLTGSVQEPGIVCETR